jgi:hypothetical protein
MFRNLKRLNRELLNNGDIALHHDQPPEVNQELNKIFTELDNYDFELFIKNTAVHMYLFSYPIIEDSHPRTDIALVEKTGNCEYYVITSDFLQRCYRDIQPSLDAFF